MKYAKVGIMILILLFVVMTCTGHKKRAEGVENKIIIFASDNDKPFISLAFQKIFDRVIHTPEPEPYFELDYKDPSDFDNLKYSHNVIVAALFTPNDTTGDFLVRSILPENQLELAIRGENQLFTTRDFFARGQVFAIMAANTERELLQSVQERGQWLYNQFDHAFIERMRNHIFKTMEQKRLSRKLKEKYGWYLRLQHDYVILQEKPEKNFVWLGRSFPYRWISIQWIDNPPVNRMNPDIVNEFVRNLPTVFYKDIRFTDYYQHMEEMSLNEWETWRVEGLWEHKSEAKGGPFISFLFYDTITDRIYHINCLIFHPGGKKILLLRQMETMIHTFSVESSQSG